MYTKSRRGESQAALYPSSSMPSFLFSVAGPLAAAQADVEGGSREPWEEVAHSESRASIGGSAVIRKPHMLIEFTPFYR